MAESDQQQGEQQANPLQVLGRALTDIRKVQNLLELKYPDQGDAIKMQREAGDLIWHEIQRQQQSQQKQKRGLGKTSGVPYAAFRSSLRRRGCWWTNGPWPLATSEGRGLPHVARPRHRCLRWSWRRGFR
jgi:hypothetical protein